MTLPQPPLLGCHFALDYEREENESTCSHFWSWSSSLFYSLQCIVDFYKANQYPVPCRRWRTTWVTAKHRHSITTSGTCPWEEEEKEFLTSQARLFWDLRMKTERLSPHAHCQWCHYMTQQKWQPTDCLFSLQNTTKDLHTSCDHRKEPVLLLVNFSNKRARFYKAQRIDSANGNWLLNVPRYFWNISFPTSLTEHSLEVF